jgi:Kef-type K+ transport system membrane component KefB
MPASLSFLPTFPDELNLLAAAGLILIAGILGARLLVRWLPVPAITGYVLIGLLIGPSGLRLVDEAMLDRLGLLIDLALGLVLFELGRRVDYRWLLRERRLLLTSIVISLTTFAALYALLVYFGVGKLVAVMVATVGMAASPAVTLNVARETRAEGQLTERMLNIVVISNVLSFIGFSMALAALHVEYKADWQSYLLHPLYLLAGSLAVGWLAGRLMIWIGQLLGNDTAAHLVLMLALISATVGLASMYSLSALIALLAFGISSRSSHPRRIVIEPDFSQFTTLLYVLLFVAAGARLDASHLPSLAPVVLAFVLGRMAVSMLLTTALAPVNGITLRKGLLLGLALAPLSGFKIVMVQQAAGAYADFGAQFAALTVSILVILELVGPICTRIALVASGEAGDPRSASQPPSRGG